MPAAFGIKIFLNLHYLFSHSISKINILVRLLFIDCFPPGGDYASYSTLQFSLTNFSST